MTAMPIDPHLPRLLIVDDEPAIQRFLKTALDNGEFTLFQAETGRAALSAAVSVKPNVILLDLGLPDMDGIEIVSRIRQWSQVPIIILSVRDRESDKIKALDAGADDYLTKPFGLGELLARIRVMLRRSLQQVPEPVFRIDELEVDLARRLVLLQGEEVALTPTEYDLLRMLITHAGKVLTHRQLLKQIWGANYLEQPHILRVNISNLRHKLEKDASRPGYIVTETGVGYRFKGQY
ncbi:MAG: two-component system OmpR family KDP operon response regulator [Desulfobulbaceae bacterium]|nr:MAG: two-component system OmpR family KDP operon response regulator [Desulfobulbaceae bacterium]